MTNKSLDDFDAVYIFFRYHFNISSVCIFMMLKQFRLGYLPSEREQIRLNVNKNEISAISKATGN